MARSVWTWIAAIVLSISCGAFSSAAVAEDRSAAELLPPTTVAFAELSSVLERTRASLAVASGDRSVSSTATPLERNRGVSIDYAGRTWVSAGRAVPFDDAQFVRVGQHAGFPIFRRIGANEGTIYLPIGTGAVAPFHAMQR